MTDSQVFDVSPMELPSAEMEKASKCKLGSEEIRNAADVLCWSWYWTSKWRQQVRDASME